MLLSRLGHLFSRSAQWLRLRSGSIASYVAMYGSTHVSPSLGRTCSWHLAS
jgi:hypothetical protein